MTLFDPAINTRLVKLVITMRMEGDPLPFHREESEGYTLESFTNDSWLEYAHAIEQSHVAESRISSYRMLETSVRNNTSYYRCEIKTDGIMTPMILTVHLYDR